MSEPKPLASLSSALLARKGGARPAMRRQSISFPAYSDHANEDLGWNDMGYDTNPDHAEPQTSDYGSEEPGQYQYNPLAGAIPEVVPAVRKQQEEIAAKLSLQTQREVDTVGEQEKKAPPKKAVVSSIKAKQPSNSRRPSQKSRTGKAKVAFTLRLDADRHLKLRLATAVRNVSAQQLVTKAVDDYLKSIPELDELAERIPSRKTV